MEIIQNPHQRIGSISNAHDGSEFESVAFNYLNSIGIPVSKNFSVPVGISSKKNHAFDLGSDQPKLIVECKSHRWTVGNKVPSAKMTTWNEAMYYFHLAPKDYRKIFFVLHHRRSGHGETLLSYYRRIYSHLIPKDVEFLEWDEHTGSIIDLLSPIS